MNTFIYLFLFFIFISLLSQSVSAHEKITLPIVDGMILDTADGFPRVKIRLKSLGTGFCSALVALGGTPANLMAPPYTWSSWYKLTPVVSGVSIKLNLMPICDGLVVGEVNFYSRR